MSAAASGRIPVLLDTDIGNDIDDAICLAHLLRREDCELVGVTTVTGRPRRRAAAADAICRAARGPDHGVPIHAGAEAALLSTTTPQLDVPQAIVLDRCDHRPASDIRPDTAVDFIRDVVRARPGEITLLAIGPLTNVALAFATYPDLPGKLRSLMIMGGAFDQGRTGRLREWNAWCDPYAAAAVYRSAGPADHASFGVNVTYRCERAIDRAMAAFQRMAGPWAVVAEMTKVWGAGHDRPRSVVFHDPLAAVAIFRDDLLTWKRGKVAVELTSSRLRGVTSLDEGRDGDPHRIAVDVDVDAFFAELLGDG